MEEGTDVRQREVEKLTEALRLCRLELASLQRSQETVLEERNLARRRVSQSRKKAVALSVALAEQFSSRKGQNTRRRSALSRVMRSRGEVRGSEARDQALIESSTLFRAAWYLRHNEDVVASGTDPALHFLRVGGPEGRDPGPKFDTKAYVAAHPGVRESGVNPLVHHLSERAIRRVS